MCLIRNHGTLCCLATLQKQYVLLMFWLPSLLCVVSVAMRLLIWSGFVRGLLKARNSRAQKAGSPKRSATPASYLKGKSRARDSIRFLARSSRSVTGKPGYNERTVCLGELYLQDVDLISKAFDHQLRRLQILGISVFLSALQLHLGKLDCMVIMADEQLKRSQSLIIITIPAYAIRHYGHNLPKRQPTTTTTATQQATAIESRLEMNIPNPKPRNSKI